MRKRPLLWTACVFLTGLAYGRYEWPILLLIPVALFFRELQIATRCSTWKIFAGRSIVLLSAFLFGCGHMQNEQTFRDKYLSKLEDGNPVTIWGEIKSIDTTEYGLRCILADCYIRIHEEGVGQKEADTYSEYAERIPCNDILVYTSSTHYQVGQIHEIKGQFQHFSRARNQGNFDSQVFYQSQKIDFIVEEESSRLMGASQSWIKKSLRKLRDNLKLVFSIGMSEHAAGFYMGMVLGDKSNLQETTKDLFTIGGISHILAISGLHVSIIGRRLYDWLRKRRISFFMAGIVAGCVLLMYCYMVGSGMSTLRAVGMMLLYFLAQYCGRSYDMLNSLGGICVLLLWENPFFLEYAGFWFSILALLGIGVVGPKLAECMVGCIPATVTPKIQGNGVKGIVGSFGMSLGITLSTLPVVAYNYYEIPLYATFVNMLALPLLPSVFLLAILGGVVGLCFPSIVSVLFLPCEWLLWFYEWLCDCVSALPGASIICGEPSVIVVIVYYGVLLAVIWWLQSMQRVSTESIGKDDEELVVNQTKAACDEDWQMKKYSMLCVIGCIVLCFGCILYPKTKPFEITFLDVGQGDGIYISTGDGTTCFIDGGSTSVDEVGEYCILPFLKSKGVSSIDYWFVTHADTDHISGLLEVLASGYEVSHLVVAEAAPRDENYEVLLTAAKQSGVSVFYMSKGEQIVTPHMVLTCLHPGKELVTDRNEASLVLELEVLKQDVEFGVLTHNQEEKTARRRKRDNVSYRALFTGDISSEIEMDLVRQGILRDVDLYKAAHHGSKYSNSLELLEVIRPELVVVSCAEKNNYGHPDIKAIEHMKKVGAEILFTMDKGQIMINIKRGRMKVDEFRR